MKRPLMALLLLFLMPLNSAAEEPWLGVGGFGGIEIPVVQDDQGNGTIFGLKGRVRVLQLLTAEPRIHFTQYGDPSFDEFTSDLQGSKITAFGLDAVLGSGFGREGLAFYGVAGVGSYKTKRDQTGQETTDLGWSGGIGFEYGVSPMMAIDVRGVVIVIPSDGGGSKKSAALYGGLNFHFGNK